MLERRILWLLNILVLLGSLAIVASLSYDILTIGRYMPDSEFMLQIQWWICLIFLVDFWVRFWLNKDKWHFVSRNFLLLIFSIPYMNIVSSSHMEISHQAHYLLGFIPLLRGGYGLLIIIRWIAGRTVTTLMFAYLSMLASITYFASLLFFVAEKGVNPAVTSYRDAIWWACMDMVTVGSNVVAMTPIGQVLSVVLACAGMMMLPIFTVYITDKVTKRREQSAK